MHSPYMPSGIFYSQTMTMNVFATSRKIVCSTYFWLYQKLEILEECFSSLCTLVFLSNVIKYASYLDRLLVSEISQMKESIEGCPFACK